MENKTFLDLVIVYIYIFNQRYNSVHYKSLHVMISRLKEQYSEEKLNKLINHTFQASIILVLVFMQ